MSRRRIQRTVVGAIALVLLSACASLEWRHFLYDVGDRYTCTQSNEGRLGEVGADAARADPAHPKSSRYDDYERRRAQQPVGPEL